VDGSRLRSSGLQLRQPYRFEGCRGFCEHHVLKPSNMTGQKPDPLRNTVSMTIVSSNYTLLLPTLLLTKLHKKIETTQNDETKMDSVKRIPCNPAHT
jgi:hypothetical protein